MDCIFLLALAFFSFFSSSFLSSNGASAGFCGGDFFAFCCGDFLFFSAAFCPFCVALLPLSVLCLWFFNFVFIHQIWRILLLWLFIVQCLLLFSLLSQCRLDLCFIHVLHHWVHHCRIICVDRWLNVTG